MQTLLIKLSVPLVKMEDGGGGVELRPAGLSEVYNWQGALWAGGPISHLPQALATSGLGQNRSDVLQGTLEELPEWPGCQEVMVASTPVPDDAVVSRVMKSRHH